MGTFFAEWELWVKLVFILSCGIVLTFAAGLIKVTTSHYQLKKLIAATIDEDDAVLRNQSGARRQLNSTPFGATALEQGFEIEGIWTSLPNTPERSDEQLVEHTSMHSSVISASTSRPCHVEQRAENSPAVPVAASKPVLIQEKNVVERMRYHDNQARSFAEYYSLFQLQHPEFSKAVNDIEDEYRTSKSHDGEQFQERVTIPNETLSHEGDRPASRPFRRHSDHLQLLDRQRQSQVAETGQIRPRARKSILDRKAAGARSSTETVHRRRTHSEDATRSKP